MVWDSKVYGELVVDLRGLHGDGLGALSAGRSPANSILSQLHIAALGCSESMGRIAVGVSQHLSIQIGTAMSCRIVILHL